MDQHQTYLKESIRLALENVEQGGDPYGAIIVKNGEVIATAVNDVRRANDPSAHAEIQAIRKACEKLGQPDIKGCILYSSCEPCPMCLGAIYWSSPDAVYFAMTKEESAEEGFSDQFIYEEIKKPIPERSIQMIQQDQDDQAEPFKKWNEKNG